MLILNTTSEYNRPLAEADVAMLSTHAARIVERHLATRPSEGPTPLLPLPTLAEDLGVGDIMIKDEGRRLGLGSFKALGGAFAVALLTLEQAERRLGRTFAIEDVADPAVRSLASELTFCCATDGNHGKSVAQGAQWVGARSVVFVHAGVSAERVAAIARFGAEVIRLEGTYDDSVAIAARTAGERSWILVSDTSWPGYERIPGLVMQGYVAIVQEALRQMGRPPTHLFIQAGVGGIAAAMAGRLQVVLGQDRPIIVVVEPERAACLQASARAGHVVRITAREPTVMAMLECYEPSLVAWRILSRLADAFMTVEEEDAVTAMNRLARPAGADPAIVSGESGAVGLAGLLKVAADGRERDRLRLGPRSRILLISTEGATDEGRFHALTGLDPNLVCRRP